MSSEGERLPEYAEHVLTARPSKYGETQAKDIARPDRAEFYGPKHSFICPECKLDFQSNAEELGIHLVNEHEPIDNQDTRVFVKPVTCGKNCGRILEGDGGEANWHMRLCKGKKDDSQARLN